MVIENSTNLKYIGQDLAKARDRGVQAKKKAELAQGSLSHLSSLGEHAARWIFGADKARKDSRTELSNTGDHTTKAREILLEVLGPDSHSELAKAAGYAAGLLSGEVAFEGKKLPAVIARADQNLTELADVINQIKTLTSTALGSSAHIHESLGEIVDTNGPLDMAADNLKAFKKQI